MKKCSTVPTRYTQKPPSLDWFRITVLNRIAATSRPHQALAAQPAAVRTEYETVMLPAASSTRAL